MKSVTFTIEEEPTQLIFGNWHRILPADDYPNPI